MKGRSIVLMAADPRELKNAAENVARSGNRLLNAVTLVKSLDHIAPVDEWAGLPVTVIARSFGTLRNFQDKIDMMRRPNITIHLPCDSRKNITGLKVLSSLGIRTLAMIWTEDPDWDSLADLAAYALLTPASHAPIEPFHHIARHYRASRYIDWEFLYFEGTKRFLRMDKKGNIVPDAPSGLEKRPHNSDHVCYRCRGWNICHGKFSAGADTGKCAEFFIDLIDSIERSKRKQKSMACGTGENTPCETEAVEGPDEWKPYVQAAPDTDRSVWIDLKGGAAEALILSSVLKQVIDKYPSRQYSVVSRTYQDPLLAGHPAILRSGNPPKGAVILRVDPQIALSGSTYQTIARSLGLEITGDENMYVPWEFEDSSALLAMVPWRKNNVLIVSRNGPGSMISSGEWESLVQIMIKNGFQVVQAGDAKDGYIRGAYDIRGLLGSRQLVSLPRHFTAMITTDLLMLYSARLCKIPSIILTGRDELSKYDGQIHMKNPPAKDIYNALAKIL